jgi:hypothetical protein
MSIAYLVLAHTQPALLARLVDRLLDEDVHVFVHIDRRSDIKPFHAALAGTESRWRGHLHWARDRRKVAYFGFSTVEATLSLMKQATAFQRFATYSLLSGADYPIKSRSHIRAVLANTDTEHIVYWKLEDRPSWQHKIEHYFLTDYIPVRNLKRPSLRQFWRVGDAFRYYYWRAFYYHRYSLPKRKFPFYNLVPYGGSQWWSLTHDCVAYILEHVATHPELVRFYRYTECPDEMFFQTIVMNSRFAAKAANYEAYRKWSSETPASEKTDASRIPESSFNLRYIDWSGHYRDERGYPFILDDRDFPALSASHCLFARKFDLQRSASLLDRIDEELLQGAGADSNAAR